VVASLALLLIGCLEPQRNHRNVKLLRVDSATTVCIEEVEDLLNLCSLHVRHLERGGEVCAATSDAHCVVLLTVLPENPSFLVWSISLAASRVA
jgi:hypothetical protein